MLPLNRSPRPITLLAIDLLALAVALVGIGCGSSGSGGSGSVPVDIAISDAPVGALQAVVITIDRVTVNRPGKDIVVEKFPADTPGDPDEDTITIDLLDYRGMSRKLIVDDLMLDPGDYQNVRLEIVDSNVMFSYVVDENGITRELKVPSGELKLGGFTVPKKGNPLFVIEFDLMKAMTFNPTPLRYILKPRGVRVVDVEVAAVLEGMVDPMLFTEGACSGKPVAEEGNVVYLYAGTGLDLNALGDLFDPAVDTAAAGVLTPPYAAEPVAADGSYMFSYLEPGAYTIAFACNAAGDDAEYDDGILIPDPSDQSAELQLDEGENQLCDFPVGPASCS